jgi:glyoxylase-like metal-dependent hydrolase (beta-lactamase superfamily II)
MEKGTAESTPSGLDHPVLDTYFRYGTAIVVWNAEQAEQYRNIYPETFVYRDEDIVIRQIDEHTWVGNGHLLYNESVYLIEGEERALLIDAGTYMPKLDRIAAMLTDKPVMLALTHLHGDHAGAVDCFPEIWMNPNDTVLIPNPNPYKGKINYLADGEIIDLGGRQIEVMYTPAHTSGSTTFFDKEHHYGFSGDAFGSTNLLLFGGTFKQLIATTSRTAAYMQKHGIEKLFPGHYQGNPETLQRILDEKKMSEEVLSGKRTGEKNNTSGLNSYIYDYGVHIRYNAPEALR